MNKLFNILFLVGLISTSANAQSSKTFYMGLGGNFSSFQDLKYSASRYDGIGGNLEIHYKQSTQKAIWSTGLSAQVNSENANLFEHGTALVIYPQIHFFYLTTIKENLYIGGHWDIMEMYYRQTSGLGNNSNYFNTGSFLAVSGLYKMDIKDKALEVGVNLGLLSYYKESTGFAFSAPQNSLEDGDFDYQDEALLDPFGFKYYEFRPLWDYFRLGISANYQLSKKFSVNYRWTMNQFSEVDNYPVTMGSNLLTIRYHFTNKQREEAKH